MNHGGLEIERKFLVFLPDEKDIPITEKWEITQTYLNRPDPDVQRRVRRIIINGSTTYYYTEKRRLTGITREENEHENMKSFLKKHWISLLLSKRDTL